MRHRLGSAAVLAVVVLAVSSCVSALTIAGSPAPSPAPLASLAAYRTQPVDWQPCPDHDGADCAVIRVPIDYDDPGAMAIDMPLIRLRATDAQARIGVLTTNPGGPGESGYQSVVDALDPDDTGLSALRTRYDLIGFDPRGVDRTEGIRCLDDRATDAYLATDFTPTDQRQLRAVAAAHRRYSSACLGNSGKLLGLVGSEYVAEDMDIMRSALGEEKLNYLGFSYGTLIGQYYAEQFPDHVGRMLLDSVDDPSYRTDRWEPEHEYRPDPAALAPRDQIVYDMLATCAARADCPLGRDADAAMRALRELIDRVDTDPIPIADGRALGSNLALVGLFEATYDESYQTWFEEAIAEAVDGDGTELAALADRYVGRDAKGRFSSADPAFWAVQCADDDPGAYGSLTEQQILDELDTRARRRAVNSPLFGVNRVFSTPVCLFWPVPPTMPSHAVRAEGAPTIVLINNTGDPATPLEDAENVANTLADAVLVINEHAGHIAFDNGSPCVDEIVIAYFLDGAVPADRTRCAGG